MSACNSQNKKFYLGMVLGINATVLIYFICWPLEFISLNQIPWVRSSRFNQENVFRYASRWLNHNTDLMSALIEDEDTIAKQMFNSVRIACLILTAPKLLDVKAIHVKNTWAKRCNLDLFMSSAQNDSFPTVGLNVTEGYDHLTAKTLHAFKYMYDHHLADADWFLKADDDTYVIMENLRYFLSNEDPSLPVYFGQRLKPFVRQGYASGGSGYVISSEALSRFGRTGFGNKEMCAGDHVYEDVAFGQCLQNLGVILKPSTDVLNRTRFHGHTLREHVHSRIPKGYMENYDFENGRSGPENISRYAISFHHVQPDEMLELEFLLYHVRPFGVLNLPVEVNVT
ncbi:unnamed protein product [Lymnaea stagnalis]|uniref:Glycoprotein-N-acetylgalactosamine 3-beta-galactosyltransferase 1 n=1 Tax=Lymnaea stagnalis TaxID=6523 RepID=A0AAV2HC14_LYMST